MGWLKAQFAAYATLIVIGVSFAILVGLYLWGYSNGKAKGVADLGRARAEWALAQEKATAKDAATSVRRLETANKKTAAAMALSDLRTVQRDAAMSRLHQRQADRGTLIIRPGYTTTAPGAPADLLPDEDGEFLTLESYAAQKYVEGYFECRARYESLSFSASDNQH